MICFLILAGMNMKDLKNSEKVLEFAQTISKWLKNVQLYNNIDKAIHSEDKMQIFARSIFDGEINIDLRDNNYYNNSS